MIRLQSYNCLKYHSSRFWYSFFPIQILHPSRELAARDSPDRRCSQETRDGRTRRTRRPRRSTRWRRRRSPQRTGSRSRRPERSRSRWPEAIKDAHSSKTSILKPFLSYVFLLLFFSPIVQTKQNYLCERKYSFEPLHAEKHFVFCLMEICEPINNKKPKHLRIICVGSFMW